MPPRPLLLLLDFDSTLTLTSTIPLLLSLSTFPTLHPLLPALSSSYTSSLASHSASYHPKKESRKTVASELAYLTTLTPIEKNSISRLENAGVWKGVTRGRIEDVAKQAVKGGKVVLRKGWGGLHA
ncbi:hypothetical protein JMJ35_007372 [Cladonia borealis]|uniref:Uncharacterized protein n=1 Tax=Cladonia borealis TaxID=184061 RepID=A0AA39QYD2_9LECA|nr:hypothetical protein JMJ35_007372 [Cladonia borealis]